MTTTIFIICAVLLVHGICVLKAGSREPIPPTWDKERSTPWRKEQRAKNLPDQTTGQEIPAQFLPTQRSKQDSALNTSADERGTRQPANFNRRKHNLARWLNASGAIQ